MKTKAWFGSRNSRIMVRKKRKVLWFFYIVLVFLLGVFTSSDTAFAFERYTRTSQAKVSGEGVEEFHLTTPGNLTGEINLQVGDEDVCRVELECWAKAKNLKMAKKFTELVEMYFGREKEVVTLKLSTPRDAPWEGTNYGVGVTLNIIIPPDLVMKTNTRAFDLDISGPLKKVNIRNRYGDIQLKDVSEETIISGTYNQVELTEIRGYVEIQTSYNKISLEDVDTEGRIAFLTTSYGEIEVKNFRGTLRAATIYSPIHASGMNLIGEKNEIKTVYSKIDLEFESIKDCELYVKNTYGNINMVVPKDLSARLILVVGRGGKIHTNGILIKPLVLVKTRLEGICGDGDSEIELDIDGIGKILVEGR